MPPSANTRDAANVISSHMHDLETSAPDIGLYKIITGDFNHCSLKTSTMDYFKHVKCSTRKDCTLDQCNTNVQDASAAVSLPPLRRPDHNLVQRISKYRPFVKSEPILIHVTQRVVCWCCWEPSGISRLHWLGCICWLGKWYQWINWICVWTCWTLCSACSSTENCKNVPK